MENIAIFYPISWRCLIRAYIEYDVSRLIGIFCRGTYLLEREKLSQKILSVSVVDENPYNTIKCISNLFSYAITYAHLLYVHKKCRLAIRSKYYAALRACVYLSQRLFCRAHLSRLVRSHNQSNTGIIHIAAIYTYIGRILFHNYNAFRNPRKHRSPVGTMRIQDSKPTNSYIPTSSPTPRIQLYDGARTAECVYKWTFNGLIGLETAVGSRV